ncbi:hypothetical protein QR685DRAFT_559767 [Neurospora intermedia]|uniref:Uncharacterized protein n=1 Tax=Neurospora intermedia TaxID=5142 RepID=A0ABR3DTB9_NEUIN
MPGRGGRNQIRSARTSAKKLVVDCHPATSGKREAELTAVFNDLAKDSGASAEQFHDRFVKSLRDMSKNLLPTADQVANNAVIAVNTANSANVNSTALVKTNDTVNANNAINAVNANSTALVPANTTNTNPVAINNMNDNINNTNKRPADNGQDNANKRSKTEDTPGTTTTFNIDSNGPSTTRFHTGVYMAEFMLVGSDSIQVHTPGVPAFVQPAFAQPAPATLAARASARAIAGATSTKGKGEGDDSPSKRPVPLDMYL